MTPQEQDNLTQENLQLKQQLAAMQQQLMTAQKMGSVGELASSITHEFNNILTTVINYAKLGMRHRTDEMRDKAFDKILSAGQRAAKITTGMLSYARSRGDRREAMQIKQLVDDILVLVEKDLHVHRIEGRTEVKGDPYAEVNSSQVQQVLLNLIINARQAMQPGGVLTVGIVEDVEHQMAEVFVQDTGSGIPPETLPHIFDKFYSTKTVDGQGQGGTGLGLALCKDVIESHRGRIRVETAIGHGTRFTIKLPLVAKPSFRRDQNSEVPAQRAG